MCVKPFDNGNDSGLAVLILHRYQHLGIKDVHQKYITFKTIMENETSTDTLLLVLHIYMIQTQIMLMHVECNMTNDHVHGFSFLQQHV